MTTTAQIIARYLLADNLPAAERVCRLELRRISGDRSAALFGLAAIARTLKRSEHERLCLEALENPHRDYTRLMHQEASLDHAAATLDGSLTIEARGFGFWSETFNALGGILLAALMKKTPRIRWGERFLFSDDPSDNAFQRFFEALPFETSDDSDDRESVTTFSNAETLRSAARHLVCREYVSPIEVLYWTIPSLDVTEGELKTHLADRLRRTLRPRRDIVDSAKLYVERTFGRLPFCAFHLRGTDKGCENPDSVTAVRETIARVSRIDREIPLYLMSDDEELAAAMQDRFGPRLSLQPFQRAKGRIGVHAHGHDIGQRERLGREILIDTLVAACASHFIGSGQSNVGAAIDLMMHHSPANICELVDQNHMLEYRHWGTVRW